MIAPVSTTMPEISIPPELIPSDGRFGSGPSKVRLESLDALARTGSQFLGTSHRRATVRDMFGRIGAGLLELFDAPDGYEVAFGLGGATAFWDAACACLIRERSQHLVFGEFSSKFAACAAGAPHLAEPDIIESEYGTRPDAEAKPGIDAYALIQSETSTGVSMPIVRPAGIDPDALVLVDATSAAGGMPVDLSETDVYYFSPQKCFGGEAGLWIAVMSPNATERVYQLSSSSDRWIPPILNLATALDNSLKNQTYNTPGLGGVFLLAESIEWILSQGGLEWAVGRCDESAAIVYGWAEQSAIAAPFVGDRADRSHTVATIDFDDSIDAAAIASMLRANGIVDTEPYRKLGRNQLRIALFPAIEPDDVRRLTQSIDFVIDRLFGP